MTPDQATANAQRLVELGNELEDRGDLDAALERYREAAFAAPGYARAYLNIGNALQRQGRLDDALRAQLAARDVDPRYAAARFNLGNLHLALGDPGAAERELREALRLAPRMTDAAIALANLYESLGRPAEAERELRHALSHDARHAGAQHNLRLLLNAQERWDEAEEAAAQAVGSDPDSASACAGLASQYVQSGRAREAEPWYRRALAADPQAWRTHSELLFSLNLRDDLDPVTIFREHRAFAAAFEHRQIPDGGAMSDPAMSNPSMSDSVMSNAVIPDGGPPDAGLPNVDDSGPRLKIGYLSGDFRQHPVALFLRPVLQHHDRGRVEVYCYSNNDVNDDFTRSLMSHADHWRDIAGLDDAAAARRVRADGIDVLVDLAGHTPRSRLLVFARRCAPVQATWLGYLNTSGLDSADFRICDRHTDPEGESEHLHSERLWRLPDSQWCYAPVIDPPPPRPAQSDETGPVIFGAFNQFPKISDACLDLWCEILRHAPVARLQVLGVPQGRAAARLLADLHRRGVAADRVTLHPRLGIAEYFSAIGGVDIALDSFPYNGATTTFDALWMGVPLVALRGDRGIARGSFSIVQTLGLRDLVAATAKEYVQHNLRLARDRDRRRELRRTLRQRLERSPLMDAAKFTRDLEQAWREMSRIASRRRP